MYKSWRPTRYGRTCQSAPTVRGYFFNSPRVFAQAHSPTVVKINLVGKHIILANSILSKTYICLIMIKSSDKIG